MKKTNKKGFTIVELVIVIAVIAILSAVLIPTFAGITEKANKSAAEQTAANAVKEYLVEETDNITDQKELLVDVGDYVVYINQANEKTVVKDKTLSKTLTAIEANKAVAVNDIKKVDNHYEVVEVAIAAGTADKPNVVTADTYFKIEVTGVIADGYTYYGTFEGCDVYVKA